MKTPDEIMAEMKALGVDLGQWGASEGGTTQLPSVARQAEALVKLRGALEGMVSKDLAALDQLREQMERLEHGGGR